MADVTLKQGDEFVVERTLHDGSGARVDLAGAAVVFSMREMLGSGIPGESIIHRQDAEILQVDEDEDTFGDVRYTGENADTEVAGGFWGEFEVEFDAGGVQTFPNGGYVTVAIYAQLDAVETS